MGAITVSFDIVSAKIRSREAKVAIVGLGLVGMEQAASFSRVGFTVLGFDVDEERIAALRQHTNGVRPMNGARPKVRFSRVSSEYEDLGEADCVVVCVPTSHSADGTPNLGSVIDTMRSVAGQLRPGMLVVLESTVPPGTTKGRVLPILESSGLAAGSDFFLAFSPERLDPGSSSHPVESIPKVVGGVTAFCTSLAADLYQHIVPAVHIVSSPEIAEMAKVFENTFRFVNISLVNELALLCGALDLDVQEVITACSTKPFAFMAHRPGPGVGGRCIPMAPRYLTWVAGEAGAELAVTTAAIEVNDAMPRLVAQRVQSLLTRSAVQTAPPQVLLLGIAYKPNLDDTRGSVALLVAAELLRAGMRVVYHDPHVPALSIDGQELHSQPLQASLLTNVDCAVLLCAHSAIDYDLVMRKARLVLDPTGRLPADGDHIFWM